MHLLGLLYLLGVGVLFIRMIIELTNVLLIIYKSEKRTIHGETVRVNENVDMPFSFFGSIVVNLDKHSMEELEEILLHESTHVRQYHSIDTVLCELFCIAFWFNPFMWLVRHEVRMNLEYLADKRVVETGYDLRRYQFHLLRLTYTKAAAKLINNFNVSPLKQRIFMMNKQQTKQMGLMKYLLFVPAIALLVFFNLSVSNAEETQDVVEVEKERPGRALEEIMIVASAPDNETPKEKERIKVQVIAKEKEREEAPVTPPPGTPKERIIVIDDNDLVFTRVETMPEFPGGDAAMYKWLAENIIYPQEAKEKGEQGTVIVRFVVKKSGEIGDIEIVREVNELLDQEAIRVISTLPDFIPGKQSGENVDVWFTLPLRFRLN